MSNEKFAVAYVANVSSCLKLTWMNNAKIRLKSKESCLTQEDKVSFTQKIVVNLFIVNELDTWSRDLKADFTLEDFLFEAVKITKKAGPDKYKYSGHSIGFDSRSELSLPDGSMGKNVIFWS